MFYIYQILHQKHPDWCLQVPGRPKQVGRNQYVLDLSRQAVLDYLFDTLSKVLNRYINTDIHKYIRLCIYYYSNS